MKYRPSLSTYVVTTLIGGLPIIALLVSNVRHQQKDDVSFVVGIVCVMLYIFLYLFTYTIEIKEGNLSKKTWVFRPKVVNLSKLKYIGTPRIKRPNDAPMLIEVSDGKVTVKINLKIFPIELTKEIRSLQVSDQH